MKSAVCRFFPVYGPRCGEKHAVMAMIARAFLRHDPFEVWGTGEQIRNWTYIDDIVEGTIQIDYDYGQQECNNVSINLFGGEIPRQGRVCYIANLANRLNSGVKWQKASR